MFIAVDPTEQDEGIILTFRQTLVSVVSRENEILISIVDIINRRCQSESGVCCSMVGIDIR